MDGNIILNRQIKAHDGWVDGVIFLQETGNDRVQSATAPWKENINNFHVELSHPSKFITCATTKTMGI